MTKTLQRKFIVTAMIAVSVLLLVLLGGINIANAFYTSQQTDRLLNVISRKEASEPISSYSDEFYGFLQPPITEDTTNSAVYFVVKSNSTGSVVKVDLTRIASVSEERAVEIAAQAFGGNRLEGKIDEYKYKITSSSDGGLTATFIDVSSQSYSIFRVFILSVLGGALCWALMLLLVVKLSKKAILPIARNMEQQRQFVTDAGHEIKTPLAIIMANTEAMELYNGSNKWTENIKGQTKRLSGLMQDLLSLAKLDEKRDSLVFEDVDMSQTMETEIQQFEEPGALKGVKIDKNIEDGVRVRANREYITRLMSILMDNAVKYALSDTDIGVTLKKESGKMVLQVKNKCDNLKEEDVSRLFDRFYMTDSARTQKNGGYGIGLSAAKAIADIHKGSIDARLEKGDTAVFEFKMPC